MQALIDALTVHPALALGAVFVAAWLESLAVIGTFIPGSSVVVIGGMLVGLHVLDAWWTALAAIAGAILGDSLSYWLGRHHHQRLGRLWPLKSYPALLQYGHDHFARHGGGSVFLARFVGPLRAIVPLVAGMSNMPLPRFMVMNVLSAVVWAAVHLLPGALFGASLKLAGAVSSRLLILLAGVAAVIWLFSVLLRLAHRRIVPFVLRRRDDLVAWAKARTGLSARVVRSLLDPAQPESIGLLLAASLLLGGGWLFLGVVEDVVTGDALVQFDHLVFTVLQRVRTAWADTLMIAATELGSAEVALPVIAGVALLLVLERHWRTLAYWLTAVVFAQALVWILKTTLGRLRPIELYEGVERFSFPSGHAASSIVLYGFLAVLLARNRTPPVRLTIGLLALLLIGLISFSRLYLGAHWLSDVLAGLSLGAAWVALLSIAYAQHAQGERLPARTMSLTALATLVLAGAAAVTSHHAADVQRYAPARAATAVPLADWHGDGWRQLPARRTEVDGDFEEPLTVQWAGTAARLEQLLHADGWRRPPVWRSRAALSWLLPDTTAAELPVLAKFHRGEPATLTLEKALDPQRRLVLRLWPTAFQVSTDNDLPAALWIGMATLERLQRPAGIATLALTDPDFALPATQLAQSLRARGARPEVRTDGARAVLLAY